MQTVHFLYHCMKLAYNVCFMNQRIFNSKYFESYYKLVSRKNIELDFCKYFYIYFMCMYNRKTIIKEKK